MLENKTLQKAVVFFAIMMAAVFFSYQNLAQEKHVNYQSVLTAHEMFNEILFTGKWSCQSPLLQSSTGVFNFYMNFSLLQSQVDKEIKSKKEFLEQENFYINILLKDPEFNDQNLVQIISNLKYLNEDNERVTFQIQSDQMSKRKNIYIFGNFQKTDELKAEIEGEISIDQKVFKENYIDFEYIKNNSNVIQIKIISKEENNPLGFSTYANYDWNAFSKGILIFALISSMAIVLAYIGSANLIKQIEQDLNYSYKLSILLIEMVLIQDIYFMIQNLFLGTLTEQNTVFIVLFIGFSVQFSFNDNRLLMLVWRLRMQKNFPSLTIQQLRTKVFLYQLKIYAYMIVYSVFMWRFFLNQYMIIFNAIILMPQIIHNIRSSQSCSFSFNLLVFFSCAKYMIFYYIRGGFISFIDIKKYQLHCLIGLALILSQLYILYHQETHGVRFFLPRFLNKGFYQYFITIEEFLNKNSVKNVGIDMNQGDKEQYKLQQETQCPICLKELSEFNKETEEDLEIQNLFLKKLYKKKGQKYLMTTPCQHYFHTGCLLKWTEIRMECPCCRNKLPTIEL